MIFLSPPWFFYEAMILAAGGTPVRVRVDAKTFELDLEAIQAAISARTRAIIVNSPNNPTGNIYSPQMLAGPGPPAGSAGQRTQRPIYLLSDESYSRILYDGRPYPSPTAFYPHSFLIYTYGKTLLTPGQRIGYIALPPAMPDRAPDAQRLLRPNSYWGGLPQCPAAVRPARPGKAIDRYPPPAAQARTAWSMPWANGLRRALAAGHLLPDAALAAEDDLAFTRQLLAHKIFCLPGAAFEMPGYFRISLTANDEMIERSLPGFEAALHAARQQSPLITSTR